MKKLFCLIFIFQNYFLFPQNKVSYYKTINSNFGTSAISNTSLTVKTFSFNYPVYKILRDTLTNHLVIGVRQKDPSGRFYTSKGYHLTLNENDSVSGILEDNKFDLSLVSDFLLLSNDRKSSRFNLTFGYEQFEYASKIIYPILHKNTGLTYNPSFKIDNEPGLSCLSLKDGSILWTAPVPAKYNWNSLTALNDSILIIAAGGLYAVNVNTGLIWTHSMSTAQKINKPLTFSSFNHSTFAGFYNPFNTSHEDAQITQIASNILITANAIYFASKQKLIAVNKDGKLIWEVDMSAVPVSNCLLFENKENILLVNLGIAQYNENTVLYGKPFISAYNKESGLMMLEKNEEAFSNIVDIETIKGAKILANKTEIIQITEDLQVQTLITLGESRFGHFLEFINGDEYFVEKEGFYVPLNFINDKIIYFKTDHGKVFGLNNNEIEYEYHYTELYKFNKNIGRKKLISQKNRTYLISENSELLYTFNSGEPAINLNNKIYFAEGRLLHVVNQNELK
jgi:hypothetical protein